jgi:hypothetical protein
MTANFTQAEWINEPTEHKVDADAVHFSTDPDTDLWQRSYYGFRRDNAPGLLLRSSENFTFTLRARFAYQGLFDQCGLLLYESSDCWCKASVEYHNATFSRLGSVVTCHGHSDWATRDIPTPTTMWYRLSRRGPDFLLESAPEDGEFAQMRVFHLHCLGETSAEMGHADPPLPPERPVHFGLYACSPTESRFTVHFDQFSLEPSIWKAHV